MNVKTLLLAATMLAGGGPTTDFVYTCEGMPPVIVRFAGNAAELRIGQRDLTLPQGRSGSGARFTDGKRVFWIKGNEATFDSGDGAPKACRLTGRG